MRNQLFGSKTVLAAVAALFFISLTLGGQTEGQAGRGSGGGEASAASPTKDLPFNPHDFSGVWIVHQRANFTLSSDPPPMTPWAKKNTTRRSQALGPDSNLWATTRL